MTTNAGSFTATAVAGSGPAPAEVFDLTSSTARYVRIQFEDTAQGNNVDVGEFAFGVVPEPTAALLVIQAIGTAVVSRRRKPREG